LAYAQQLLNNRTDKALATRVWLHTNKWTQDPDHPDQTRQWTDDKFRFNDISRCIERDTGLVVSERTVREVISKMCQASEDNLFPP
jgi:hypothetical protein